MLLNINEDTHTTVPISIVNVVSKTNSKPFRFWLAQYHNIWPV